MTEQVTVTGPEPALYSLGPRMEPGGGSYSTVMLTATGITERSKYACDFFSCSGKYNNSDHNLTF